MGKKHNKEKHNDCPIDENPTECSLRQGCRYWNLHMKRCFYPEEKAKQKEKEKAERFRDDDILSRIRLT